MTTPAPPPELQRLRRGFIVSVILQACFGAVAVAFAVAYFVFHLAWGAAAFALAVAAAAVAQIRFIWMFGKHRP
jgi:hypothetical protein